MATVSDVEEFSYIVPEWLWREKPNTVLRNARQMARRKRIDVGGEPDEVTVVLRWQRRKSAQDAA